MLCCAIKPLCAWNCQVSQPHTLAQTHLLLFLHLMVLVGRTVCAVLWNTYEACSVLS